MNKRPVSSPDRLAREAARLLAALEPEESSATADPIEAGLVTVRQRRGTVSIAAGRFRQEALDALLRRGLAERAPSGAVIIAEAGRAHLRRLRSRPEEGFRAQHGDLVDAALDGDAPARVRRDASESPLAWLRRRKGRDGQPLIDAAAFEAGERLRRDLTLARWLPGVTVNWDATPGGSSGGPRDPAASTDAALAARQRVDRALRAVGADLSGLLVDLCGFLKGLERIERERGWPPRSAKVIAALALGRLAEHYGLQREARGPERSRGVRGWRPSMPEGGPVGGELAEEEAGSGRGG